MTDIDPQRTSVCSDDRHGLCNHHTGWSRERSGPFVQRLCTCDCHLSCPLGGVDVVQGGEWLARCTCPGATTAIAIGTAAKERGAERAALYARSRPAGAAVKAETVRGTSPTRVELDRRVRAIAELHRVDWSDTEVDLHVDLLAARAGSEYLQTPRVLRAAVRSLRRALQERKVTSRE